MWRVARRILISTVFGVVATVLIAWGFAWLNRIDLYNRYATGVTTYSDSGWFVDAYREIGSTYTSGQSVWDLSRGHRRWWDGGLLPPGAIGRIPDLFLEQPRGSHDRSRQERGFPFLALASEELSEPITYRVPGGVLRKGIRVPPPRVSEYGFDEIDYFYDEDSNAPLVVLPLQPIWPRFALDVLSYGSFWFLIASLRGFVKRRNTLLSGRIAVLTGALLFTLGAITTIGVAWLCALNVDENFDEYGPEDGFGTDGYSEDNFGLGRWWLFRNQEPGAMRLTSDLKIGGGGIGSGGPNCDTKDIWPSWATFVRPPQEWLERDENEFGGYHVNPGMGYAGIQADEPVGEADCRCTRLADARHVVRHDASRNPAEKRRRDHV